MFESENLFDFLLFSSIELSSQSSFQQTSLHLSLPRAWLLPVMVERLFDGVKVHEHCRPHKIH